MLGKKEIWEEIGKKEKEASKRHRKKGQELASDGDLLFLLSLVSH